MHVTFHTFLIFVRDGWRQWSCFSWTKRHQLSLPRGGRDQWPVYMVVTEENVIVSSTNLVTAVVGSLLTPTSFIVGQGAVLE
jgi:hypothetical protein